MLGTRRASQWAVVTGNGPFDPKVNRPMLIGLNSLVATSIQFMFLCSLTPLRLTNSICITKK